MKESKRIVRISFFLMGIFILLSSCAEKKTYGEDEPNSPSANNQVDICRIGDDVIRLSVSQGNAFGMGEIFLSSSNEFSATPYQITNVKYSWASNFNYEQALYPFYLEQLGDNKYYYYVSASNDKKIASGSLFKKDVADILKVKKMTVSSDHVNLVLSVPVWFLNIVDSTTPGNSQAYLPAPGSLDYINHEISYAFYFRDTSSISTLSLYFSTKEGASFYTSIMLKPE